MPSPLTLLLGGGLFLLPLFLSLSPQPAADAPPPAAPNRYVGAKVCKNCHDGVDKGDIFTKWEKSAHAKAFATLATDAAKAAGKKLGVDEPQKSDQCLKCHVTAFGVDAKEIKRGFTMEDGVQCESCHGPGENHFKTRFKESQSSGAPAPITADEIKSGRDVKQCTGCHNQDSPTYKVFCLKERMLVIEHLDPRVARSKEQLEKLRATCTPDCEKACDKKEDGGDAGQKKDKGSDK